VEINVLKLGNTLVRMTCCKTQLKKNQTPSQYNTFHSKLSKMKVKVPKYRPKQHDNWR